MKAREIGERFGYTPDELTLKDVITVGPNHADVGKEIRCKVSWHGTMLDIEAEVDGKEILLTFADDQVKALIAFWQKFQKEPEDEPKD